MAYKLLNKKLCTIIDECSYYRYEILVNTTDDLPEVAEDWSPGSLALIANERKIKILNNDFQWV